MNWAKWRYVLFVLRKEDVVWEPIDWSSIALYNLEEVILRGEQRVNRILLGKYYPAAKYEFMTSEELCDYLDGIDHPYIEY